jgi:hypothetical protein
VKKLVVVLAIAMIALGGGTIHLWRQLDAGHRQIADLQARLKDMEAALQASAAANAAAIARPVPAVANSPAAPAAPPARVAAANTASAPVEDMIKQMTNPEGRDVRRGQLRMRLPQQYPDIGKWLNLSRDEENKLLDLIARQQSEESEAALNPANRNIPAAEQIRSIQARHQANDVELSALLGNKFAQFQEYQQTLPVHRQVSQLQAMLGSGADGMNDAQSRSLTTALVAEQLRINQERSGAPPATPGRTLQESMQEQQQRTAENNRRLLEVASSKLNAQQLAGYRNMIEQQEKSSSAMLRSLVDAEGRAAAAAPTTPGAR